MGEILETEEVVVRKEASGKSLGGEYAENWEMLGMKHENTAPTCFFDWSSLPFDHSARCVVNHSKEIRTMACLCRARFGTSSFTAVFPHISRWWVPSGRFALGGRGSSQRRALMSSV